MGRSSPSELGPLSAWAVRAWAGSVSLALLRGLQRFSVLGAPLPRAVALCARLSAHLVVQDALCGCAVPALGAWLVALGPGATMYLWPGPPVPPAHGPTPDQPLGLWGGRARVPARTTPARTTGHPLWGGSAAPRFTVFPSDRCLDRNQRLLKSWSQVSQDFSPFSIFLSLEVGCINSLMLDPHLVHLSTVSCPWHCT